MRWGLTEPGRRWGAVVAAGLVTAAVVVAVLVVDARPPGPVPASAAGREFSAARAVTQLERFAQRPRPAGSPESDRVRDLLAGQLRTYGLDVRVDEGVGGFTAGGGMAFGRVENVVGTLPGTDPSGTVVLAAHYDSVEAGPGASDDGAAVAAVLETVRAVRAGGPMRNDLVVLFTDGEEPGLLGASAFRHGDPLAGEEGVVMNWEARGTSGPSQLFETTEGNADLVRTFAREAPYPYGESSSAALYQLLPNATDFTELRKAGFSGLNFAYAGGSAHYHTAGDSIANLDRGSLQHHGGNMLALTRAFGNGDLDRPTGGRDGDVTFFRLLGQFVTYPDAAVLPAALVHLALLVLLVVVARRARLLTVPRTLLAALSTLLPLAVAVGLGLLFTTVLLGVRPGYGALLTGAPYRAGWYELALAALAAGALVTWYALLRRRLGPAALAVGALTLPTLLGVACAVLLPPAAYLFTVPALAMTVGALVALAVRRLGGWAQVTALLVSSVPATGLVALFGHNTADTGVINGAAPAAGVFALCGLLLLPLLDWAFPTADAPLPRYRAFAVPALAVAVAVACTGVGLGVDRFDAQHPRPAHLAYVLDAETRTARWVSADDDAAPWARGYVKERGRPPLPYRDGAATSQWVGTAPVVDAAPPDVRVVDRAGDGLRLRVSSRRHARTVVLVFDRTPNTVTVRMASRPPLRLSATAGDGTSGFQVKLTDVPASGTTLDLGTRTPGSSPTEVTAFDQTEGLDDVPGYEPRPTGLQRSGMQDSDQVIVGSAHQL